MSKTDNEEKWRIARERALRSIENMTDEEDARLTAAALADPDNPPLTEKFWRNARRAEDVAPEIVARYLARTRGQRGPQKTPTKKLVSLRLDRDVLSHFRATGPGWQARMNAALRVAAGFEADA